MVYHLIQTRRLRCNETDTIIVNTRFHTIKALDNGSNNCIIITLKGILPTACHLFTTIRSSPILQSAFLTVLIRVRLYLSLNKFWYVGSFSANPSLCILSISLLLSRLRWLLSSLVCLNSPSEDAAPNAFVPILDNDSRHWVILVL